MASENDQDLLNLVQIIEEKWTTIKEQFNALKDKKELAITESSLISGLSDMAKHDEIQKFWLFMLKIGKLDDDEDVDRKTYSEVIQAIKALESTKQAKEAPNTISLEEKAEKSVVEDIKPKVKNIPVSEENNTIAQAPATEQTKKAQQNGLQDQKSSENKIQNLKISETSSQPSFLNKLQPEKSPLQDQRSLFIQNDSIHDDTQQLLQNLNFTQNESKQIPDSNLITSSFSRLKPKEAKTLDDMLRQLGGRRAPTPMPQSSQHRGYFSQTTDTGLKDLTERGNFDLKREWLQQENPKPMMYGKPIGINQPARQPFTQSIGQGTDSRFHIRRQAEIQDFYTSFNNWHRPNSGFTYSGGKSTNIPQNRRYN